MMKITVARYWIFKAHFLNNYIMKKLLLITISLVTIISCSRDDNDTETIHIQKVEEESNEPIFKYSGLLIEGVNRTYEIKTQGKKVLYLKIYDEETGMLIDSAFDKQAIYNEIRDVYSVKFDSENRDRKYEIFFRENPITISVSYIHPNGNPLSNSAELQRVN